VDGKQDCDERGELCLHLFLHVLVHFLAWYHDSLHLILKFQVCPTKMKDLLLNLVLLSTWNVMHTQGQPHYQQMLILLFSSHCTDVSPKILKPPSTHMEDVRLLPITWHSGCIPAWPSPLPQHHWMTNLSVLPFPAIHIGPILPFWGRGHDLHKCFFHLMEHCPYSYSYSGLVLMKQITDLHHNGVNQWQFSFPCPNYNHHHHHFL
jgi:hypothetical protein